MYFMTTLLSLSPCANITCKMDTLPFELTTAIAQNLNLKDAENAYKGLKSKVPEGSNDLFVAALEERLDPCMYLRDLTAKPRELLEIMERNKCIIYGNRTVSYFFPNINLPTENWRIACADSNAFSFMEDSASIGMVWRSEANPLLRHDGKIRVYAKIHIGFSINAKGQYVIVELVDLYSRTPLHAVMREMTTISQCFISYPASCHLYYTAVTSNMNITWRCNLFAGLEYSQLEAQHCETCRTIKTVFQGEDDIEYLMNHFMVDIATMATSYGTDIQNVKLNKETATGWLSSIYDVNVAKLLDMILTDCNCNYKRNIREINAYIKHNIKFIEGYHLKSDTTANLRYIDDEYTYVYRNVEINFRGPYMFESNADPVFCFDLEAEDEDVHYLNVSWKEYNNRIEINTYV